jgi:hypothetical protein
MAEAKIPVPSLTEAQNAEAVAPSSLAGYATFQRAINVTLPAQLKAANGLLREATATLGGKGQ